MALDWDKMRVFHAVAVAGSFTRTTDILNISQSAISRQVSILEDELGCPLFERLPRGLKLTPEGEMLNKVVTNVFGKLAMVETALTEEKSVSKGDLVIMAPSSIGTCLIAPNLKAFLDTYPDMRLDLRLASEDIDLPSHGIDVAVMSVKVDKNPDFVISEPVKLKVRVYASKSYLEKHGTPQTYADLDNHRLIVSGQGTGGNISRNWLLNVGCNQPRTPYMVVESSLGIVEAIRSGIGIGYSYKYVVGEDHDLTEILTDQPHTYHTRSIAYPKPIADLKRTTVFANFLLNLLKEAEA